MAENVRFIDYRLYDVVFLGDLKLYFGRNDQGQVLRIESMSGAKLPKHGKVAIVPPTHKFIATTAEVS